jgi:ABC-type uncharacterized transport system substrate-binding protein
VLDKYELLISKAIGNIFAGWATSKDRTSRLLIVSATSTVLGCRRSQKSCCDSPSCHLCRRPHSRNGGEKRSARDADRLCAAHRSDQGGTGQELGARPGSTVTGTLTQVDGLMGKQVELVRELIPHATTVGVLLDPQNQTHAGLRNEIEAAASAAGIKVVAASASSKAEIAPAFQKLSQAGAQAVIVPRDGLFLAESGRITELARAARVPTAHSLREETEAGGLISYGVNVPANFRRAAYFVDKILKGAKPADLPIEFPTRLELVINLKTAKALGLEVPPSLLSRADEVIE